jgi:hypothetical protein
MGHNNCPTKAMLRKTKRVRCLGFHKNDVWFKGSKYHRFCPACTSKRQREPNPPRAAIPLHSSYDD